MAKASEYIYSSASNYVLDTGLITITKADNPVVEVSNFNNFTKYNNYCFNVIALRGRETIAEQGLLQSRLQL